MEISPRHKAALEWAAAGYPIFPCLPGTKRPAFRGSFYDSTTDLDQINRWWAEADYNLAWCPAMSDCAVVDLDTSKPSWSEKSDTIRNALPDTRLVETPSGGRHLHYRGTVKGSVTRLAPAIDTRSEGTYVLLPPSIVDGKEYRYLNDRPLTELPEWVRTSLERVEAREADDKALDTPANIAAAVSYIKNLEPVAEKDGADQKTLKAACVLRDIGLSHNAIFDIMLEHYKCEPRDERFEAFLRRKIENTKYRENKGAVDARPDFSASFGNLPAVQAALSEPPKLPWTFYRRHQFKNLPEPEWLIPELIQKRSIVMIYGQPGSLKSYAAVDVVLSIGCNKAWNGAVPSASGPIIYAVNEGLIGIPGRVAAWEKLHLGENGEAENFILCPAPILSGPDEVQKFGDGITKILSGQKPAAIVLDTTAKVMLGLNENDAMDVGRFIKFCESLRDAFDCVVIVIHHTRKDGTAIRGSEAFRGGFDTLIECIRPAHTDNPDRKVNAMSMHIRRQKDGIEREDPWYFEAPEFAGNRVLQAIDAATFHKLASDDDPTERTTVGAALVKIGAISPDKGVTLRALVNTLCPMLPNEGPERHEEKIIRLEKKIRAASKGKLAGYTDGKVWYAEISG